MYHRWEELPSLSRLSSHYLRKEHQAIELDVPDLPAQASMDEATVLEIFAATTGQLGK